MDRLRQLVSNISAQLRVLSVSQRLAIGLCAALAAVSMLWLLQWSTKPELVPLLTHDFSYDELDAAEKSLKDNGVPYEIRGTRLLVPARARHNALRLLHAAEALPDGGMFDMEAVVTDSNPFQSPEARVYAQTYAKGNELAKIISTSPYVSSASVILNPVTKRRLGGITDIPSASVTVKLAGGREMTQEVVEGFAKLVAGAVAGLKPHRVYIIDAKTLRSYGVPQPGDAASFDVLSMIKRHEEHYLAKILGKLSDIPGVQVAVTVELDLTKRITQNIKHDPPQPKIESSNSAEQSSAGRATEPGVQANLGQALTAGGSGPSNSTEETSVENFEPKISQTETIEQMPFATRHVTAAVGIPRSFIVGVYRAQHAEDADDPKDDDPDFISIRDAQVLRVKTSVERIIMAKTPNDVEVDVYPDMEWTADGSSWSRAPGGLRLAEQGADSFDAEALISSYAPQAGLVAMALVSLFMMMRMVRKSSELAGDRARVIRDAAEPPEDDMMLTVGPSPIGEAEVSESALTGQELDPESLRYQELGQEVSKMVEDDPASAAELVRQWVDDTE